METLRKKRTDKDFSKYVLEEIRPNDDILVYKFGVPDKYCGSLVFINAYGVLSVTGDYGNWIFCREFSASPDGYVSDGYWCEKLRIASTQKPSDYDHEATREEIKEMLNEEDIDEEDKEYLEDLLDHLDEGEERYLVYAHDNLPKGRDHEFVPLRKKLNPWLEVIFDAFEEICERKSMSEKTVKEKG